MLFVCVCVCAIMWCIACCDNCVWHGEGCVSRWHWQGAHGCRPSDQVMIHQCYSLSPPPPQKKLHHVIVTLQSYRRALLRRVCEWWGLRWLYESVCRFGVSSPQPYSREICCCCSQPQLTICNHSETGFIVLFLTTVNDRQWVFDMTWISESRRPNEIDLLLSSWFTEIKSS